MEATDPYARHWRGVRKRYYLLLAVVLGFIPTGLLAEAIERRLWPSSKALENIAFTAYCLLILLAFSHARRVTCPRCGQPFTARLFWHNDFALRCLHCGLPRGASLAQVESGTAVVPSFSWARIFRLATAWLEILLGVILLIAGGLGVRSSSFVDGTRLAVFGLLGFLVPGVVLTLQRRWRLWLQPLPIVATVTSYWLLVH